jgi:Holliday junction resolvase
VAHRPLVKMIRRRGGKTVRRPHSQVETDQGAVPQVQAGAVEGVVAAICLEAIFICLEPIFICNSSGLI